MGGQFQLSREEPLRAANRNCELLTKQFSKTFYLGSKLLPKSTRKHIWAIYAWCRRTDDIVDSPRVGDDKSTLKNALELWEERLENLWKGSPSDNYDLALANTVQSFPSMEQQPFKDMIIGMAMDIPVVGKCRYSTFEDLYLYCYRVAGTVSLMTLPILRTADGYSLKDAQSRALALGIAFQLTNILRDVGEDARRGRIYLPLDEIKEFGLTEEDILRGEISPKYREFMTFQIARARKYYSIAERGISMLSPDVRFAIRLALNLYRYVLNAIEKNDYDNFRKRAHVTKLQKLGIVVSTMFSCVYDRFRRNTVFQ
jgi:phytoene synthase